MNAILTALTLTASGSPPPTAAIGYSMFSAGSAKYHMVTADLSTSRVAPGTVHRKRLTSILDIVKEEKPAAAITGTFFNPSSHIPVADVVVDGKLVATGSRGSAVAVDWYGDVHLFDPKFKEQVDWMSYRFMLRGTVRIVHRGKLAINPQGQKFKDKSIWGKAARTAIGKNKGGKLVLVATNSSVSLSELGNALIAQGVTEAVSLDGGSSTCLYYRGSLVVPPKRKLSNLFVLHEK